MIKGISRTGFMIAVTGVSVAATEARLFAAPIGAKLQRGPFIHRPPWTKRYKHYPQDVCDPEVPPQPPYASPGLLLAQRLWDAQINPNSPYGDVYKNIKEAATYYDYHDVGTEDPTRLFRYIRQLADLPESWKNLDVWRVYKAAIYHFASILDAFDLVWEGTAIGSFPNGLGNEGNCGRAFHSVQLAAPDTGKPGHHK